MKTQVLLIVFIIVYWMVGFYPFHLTGPFAFQRGEITESATQGFIFQQRSIASSNSVLSWMADAISKNCLRIKFNIITADTEQKGLARILTISQDENNRNITLGQKLDNLIIYVRAVADDPRGDVYVVPRIFAEAKRLSLQVDLIPDRIQIDVNGTQRLSAVLPENFMESWNPDYMLALGNEMTYAFPWQGELSPVEVDVGSNSYTYSFDDLNTSGDYQAGLSLIDYKLRNSVSFREWRQDVKGDWIVNFLGFVPLGMLLAMARKKTMRIVTGALICALLSLSIETGQFFIESRTPQIIDLILNTLGGGVGAWMGAWIKHLGWNGMPG